MPVPETAMPVAIIPLGSGVTFVIVVAPEAKSPVRLVSLKVIAFLVVPVATALMVAVPLPTEVIVVPAGIPETETPWPATTLVVTRFVRTLLPVSKSPVVEPVKVIVVPEEAVVG